MMHKTLESYYNDVPHDEDQEHPDGPLWLIASPDDWLMLPQGIPLEHATTGKTVLYWRGMETPLNEYGVRGYRG